MTWEYAPEDVSTCSIIHPAVFPEVRIVPGGLLVRSFGAFNEYVAREKVAVNLCLRGEIVERLFDDFFYRTRGIRRDTCSSRGTILIRATIDRPKTCS